MRMAMPTTPATSRVEKPLAASPPADALADLREHVGEHETSRNGWRMVRG